MLNIQNRNRPRSAYTMSTVTLYTLLQNRKAIRLHLQRLNEN